MLVTDAAEVAELAARIGDDLLPAGTAGPGPAAPGDDLDPESYRVWSAVPLRGGATVDRLASAGGVEPRRLVGILAAARGRRAGHQGMRAGGARHAAHRPANSRG